MTQPPAPDPVSVSSETRARLGRKLRALRIERGLTQRAVAREVQARGGTLAIGTIQAIEGAWYPVKVANLDRYARALGTTLSALVAAATPAPASELLDEHLDIARAYMRARRATRASVEGLLAPGAPPAWPTIVAQVIALGSEAAAPVGELIGVVARAPTTLPLLRRIAQQLAASPATMARWQRLVAVEEQLAASAGDPARRQASLADRLAKIDLALRGDPKLLHLAESLVAAQQQVTAAATPATTAMPGRVRARR
jgi:transcriptional regulator with XRE-family HTH domain